MVHSNSEPKRYQDSTNLQNSQIAYANKKSINFNVFKCFFVYNEPVTTNNIDGEMWVILPSARNSHKYTEMNKFYDY